MTIPDATLKIEGGMTIYQALEQRQTILAALNDAARLEIDLAGVTELDTAGVQVLILAKKTAQASGRQLRVAGQSPAVQQAFALLRLDAFFHEPQPSGQRHAAGGTALLPAREWP